MKTAFIFPGQGSQSLGMLDELYQNFDIVKQTFNQANDVLGFDLWDIIQNDNDKLGQTLYTQNAMLTSGYACYLVLQQETNIKAEIIAGHSLGEITALVACGSLDFDSSLQIVKKRATLMQEAVPKGVGSMAAILGLEDDKVIEICNNYQGCGIVEAVNFNANGQVVIAGNTDAVATTCEVMKENGAKKAIVLPVSVPSHSSLMDDAGAEFLEFLNDFEFKIGDAPILHNVDGKVAKDSADMREKIAKQLYNPVLWTKIINNMAESDISQTIELGPGKVLSGLNRRINKNISSKMLFDLKTLENLKC